MDGQRTYEVLTEWICNVVSVSYSQYLRRSIGGRSTQRRRASFFPYSNNDDDSHSVRAWMCHHQRPNHIIITRLSNRPSLPPLCSLLNLDAILKMARLLWRWQLLIITIACMEQHITLSLQSPTRSYQRSRFGVGGPLPVRTTTTTSSSMTTTPSTTTTTTTTPTRTTRTTTTTRLHAESSTLQDQDSSLFWPVADGDHQDDDNDGDCGDDDDDDPWSALDSIVKIHATHSEPDYTMPWQKQHQTTSTSSGFAIFVDKIGFRIMTNAHSVEYGSIIQVQKRGGEQKYQAQVESVGNECDLAILTIDSDEFWNGLKELEFGDLPTLQDEVEVLGFPTGGDALSITSGVVSRIEMQEYTQADTHLLAIQIDAAINAGNSGGPVVDEDQNVVGVAFQALDGAENIGYVVPVTVVQHFLEDIRRNGKYTGFCEMGVGLSMLENKTFRKYLRMGDTQSGVMVRKVAPTAPASDILKEKDVILSVDGISVANDGKIPFRRGERVSLACYTQTKFVGDSIRLNVLRDGEELELSVPVDIGRRLVRAHWDNQPPPYMIVSGLVFTALSVPLLYAINAWEGYISDNVSYLLGQVNTPLERKTDEVVVLVQVLAHSENLGYDKLSDLHLDKFNGEKVRSLAHLKNLIMISEDPFIKFEFAPSGLNVVMERSSIDAVTTSVCNEHRIQEMWTLHNNDATKEEKVEETSNRKQY